MTNRIIETLLAEQAAALARREAARRQFVAADAEAIALRTLMFDRGRELASQEWLRAGERAADAYWSAFMPEPTPAQVAEALQRCSELLARLAIDPSEKLAPSRYQHATPTRDQDSLWRGVGFQARLSTPAQLSEPGTIVER